MQLQLYISIRLFGLPVSLAEGQADTYRGSQAYFLLWVFSRLLGFAGWLCPHFLLHVPGAF